MSGKLFTKRECVALYGVLYNGLASGEVEFETLSRLLGYPTTKNPSAGPRTARELEKSGEVGALWTALIVGD
jgi:hypothetical protein